MKSHAMNDGSLHTPRRALVKLFKLMYPPSGDFVHSLQRFPSEAPKRHFPKEVGDPLGRVNLILSVLIL